MRLIALPYGNGSNGNPVDIYYVDNQAAKLITELQDPYLYPNYTNHYGGIVTFAYLPLIPLYYAMFVLAGLDIRYGSIIADVLTTLALYFIARSSLTVGRDWIIRAGALAYAILPVSIWLTSVVGSNLMIGSMFLMVSLAALLGGKEVVAGILLGLALAANQLVILALPIVVIYCLRLHNLKTPVVSVLVSSGIVLPFLLYSPSRFLDDVALFQFERPLQQNGVWSLYYIVHSATGFGMDAILRISIFLVPAAVVSVYLSKTRTGVLVGILGISTLGAFVLPIDGFWSYFLLPITVCCALIPVGVYRVTKTLA